MRRRPYLAALALTATALVGCGQQATDDPQPSPGVSIDAAIFSQAQSTPGFDSASYTVDDAAALAELEAVIDAGGIGQADYVQEGETPPGALQTFVTVTWSDEHQSSIEVWGATGATDFEVQLASLVTEWHGSGDFEPVTVP